MFILKAKRLWAAGLFAALAVLIGVEYVDAAQVAPGTFRCPGQLFYGRTDGICSSTTEKNLYAVENGTQVKVAGKGLTIDFTGYADGEQLVALEEDGTAASATALAVNHLYLPGGVVLAQTGFGTQSAGADMDAGSLDISGDQTADDGVEIWQGTVGASGAPFIVGTDPAFKFCATFAVEDVSGADEFHMGFRKPLTATATFDDNQSFATLGWNAAANPADIDIETDDDGAGTTTTNTTDTLADATSTTWCVFVSDTGVVTYTIDGAAPSTTAAFTFDTGETLVPFFTLTQDTALTGEVDLTSWNVQYQ